MPAVTISHEAGGIAVVTIAKEPVNSMDLGLWKEILAAVETLEEDPKVRGMVFCSGLKKDVFTAGLDIKELYAPMTNEARLKDFWRTLSTALVKIYSSNKVTASAIRGACPAGGCCLSLCCDFRFITADGSMGLNEVALGIPVPIYWIERFKQVTGHQQAERLLLLAEMPPAPRLLQLGLVDAVVASKEELLSSTLEEMRKWLKFPDGGRMITKRVLRGDLADRWADGVESEANDVWTSISNPSTVKSLQKTLQRLGALPKETSKL